MRSFLFTLFLFAVLSAVILANAAYIHRLADEMLTLLDSLPSHAIDGENSQITMLEGKWTKAEKWVSLSVGHEEINRIGQAVAMIRVYYAAKSDVDYLASCDTLRGEIENLRHFERFSLDNLL